MEVDKPTITSAQFWLMREVQKQQRKGGMFSFDVLPHDYNAIKNITQSKLSVLAPGEDKNPMEAEKTRMQAEELEKIQNEKEEKKKKSSPMVQSQKEFVALAMQPLNQRFFYDALWQESRQVF